MSSELVKFTRQAQESLEIIKYGEPEDFDFAYFRLPKLSRVLRNINAGSGEQFIGVGFDGVPLMLNVNANGYGPIAMVAERGAGKTSFLKALAITAEHFHTDRFTNLVVVTDNVAEWMPVYHRSRIMRLVHPGSFDTAYELGNMFLRIRESQQPFDNELLLVDGFDKLLFEETHAPKLIRLLAHQQIPEREYENVLELLDFVMHQGPQRQIWTAVTVNGETGLEALGALGDLHGLIYGKNSAPEILGDPLTRDQNLDYLYPGTEFNDQKGGGSYMPFWLPEVR